MSLDRTTLPLLQEALEKLDEGFSNLPAVRNESDMEAMRSVLLEAAERMQDNCPYPHPFYAGQMLKPPHPIARTAYALAQWINPNNHALDGGRASSALEKEAVADLAGIFGWQSHLGHLTSGGTFANLEALWAAGRLSEGKKVVASSQAHYTHSRISEVLRLDFESIPCDQHARMNVAALDERLKLGDIGTVVVTLGTTAAGTVDPLPEILKLKEHHDFRIHVDAAYGGYYKLVKDLPPHVRTAYDQISEADSIVIDPHKHGLQPYGCGCVLFKDPAVGSLYKHDSPYTYFSSAELHLGEISLECSRAGASAVALWATQKLLPLTPDGEFAAGLDECLLAAKAMAQRIDADDRLMRPFTPDLDIVIWAPKSASVSQASELSRRIFERAAEMDIHLAVADFPAAIVRGNLPDMEWDQDSIACLRSCLIKPEHHEWMPQIWERLEKVYDELLGRA